MSFGWLSDAGMDEIMQSTQRAKMFNYVFDLLAPLGGQKVNELGLKNIVKVNEHKLYILCQNMGRDSWAVNEKALNNDSKPVNLILVCISFSDFDKNQCQGILYSAKLSEIENKINNGSTDKNQNRYATPDHFNDKVEFSDLLYALKKIINIIK